MSEKLKLEEASAPIDLLNLIDDMWKGFKRLFWLLFVLMCVCGTGCYLYAQNSYQPEYTAYSSFVVTTNNYYYSEYSYYNQTTATQMSKTFPYILTSGMLQQIVMEDLGLSTMPVEISTDTVEDTNLFTITVTGADPQLCYDVLQSVIENYPAVAEYIIGSTVLSEIDSSGVPATVSNPTSFRRYVIYGAAVGVLIFLVVLVLYAALHKTIRSEADLKKITNVRSFGVIPQARFKKRKKNASQQVLINNKIIPANFKEALRTLRTRLEAESRERDIHSFLITSSIPGEGKTTMSVNVALSLASKGKKVLLVDGDLRSPSVGQKLGIQSENGLYEYLSGDCALNDIMVRYENMYVLLGGAPTNHPAPLLSSPRMARLIRDAKKTFDFLIIDTPPCGILSDASILGRQLDGAILVVRQDYAQTASVEQAFETISETGVNILGCMLNGAEVGITGYGYGYGYGYGKYGYGKYGYGRYGYGSQKAERRAGSTNDERQNGRQED